MKSNSLIGLAATLSTAFASAAVADPLPPWNETDSRTAILIFVNGGPIRLQTVM